MPIVPWDAFAAPIPDLHEKCSSPNPPDGHRRHHHLFGLLSASHHTRANDGPASRFDSAISPQRAAAPGYGAFSNRQHLWRSAPSHLSFGRVAGQFFLSTAHFDG